MKREYEDIPQVFPEDYGTIPPPPSFWDNIKMFFEAEILRKGGLTNMLLMKDDQGKINYQAFGVIYVSFAMILASFCYILSGVKNEF